MKTFLLFPCILFCACGALSAHVISMSSGFATVRGRNVEYIFRIPDYEMAHVRDPASLFDHIRFSSNGEEGVRTGQECHPDPANGVYLCASDYRFSHPVETLDVECSFYQVTVPNHVHMLHAERGGKYDQAILDRSFPSANLAFRPPTRAEIALTQTGAGFVQVLTSGAQLLLLFAIVLASRNAWELSRNTLCFLGGECAGAVFFLHSAWQPPPRFAECAAALALSYLSLEIAAFPHSRGRWVMALALGLFWGMYFTLFIAESGYASGWVLAGAAFAGGVVTAILGVTYAALRRAPIRDSFRNHALRAAASVLLCTGAAWFVLRLRG